MSEMCAMIAAEAPRRRIAASPHHARTGTPGLTDLDRPLPLPLSVSVAVDASASNSLSTVSIIITLLALRRPVRPLPLSSSTPPSASSFSLTSASASGSWLVDPTAISGLITPFLHAHSPRELDPDRLRLPLLLSLRALLRRERECERALERDERRRERCACSVWRCRSRSRSSSVEHGGWRIAIGSERTSSCAGSGESGRERGPAAAAMGAMTTGAFAGVAEPLFAGVAGCDGSFAANGA